MPYFKVKIEQGAFIGGSLFRPDEVVELPEGENPNWGVRCERDGTELESMSDKVLNRNKMNEQLAKSIGGDNAKAMKQLALENAELKQRLANIESMLSTQLANKVAEPEVDTTPDPEPEDDGDENDNEETDGQGTPDGDGVAVEEVLYKQIAEAVEMLEDGNDEHWTSRGEPQMKVLEDILGTKDFTRADVEKANPRKRKTK